MSMASEPFTSQNSAAPNIKELMNYLYAIDDGNFLYRGQIRRYEGPLIPSAFRGILRENPIISDNDSELAFSMRKIGRRFIGNFIWDKEDHYNNYFSQIIEEDLNSINRTVNGTRDAEAYIKTHFVSTGSFAINSNQSSSIGQRFIDFTTSSLDFNKLIEQYGGRLAVSIMLQKAFPGIKQQLPLLCNYVDNCHRSLFSNDILINSMGYLLGSLLSQHYGFSSGYLDATTSIEIAAFFATHAAPNYNFLGTSGPNKCGVIYRIPNMASPLEMDQLYNLSYYSAPGTLITWDILSRLEKEISVLESLESMRTSFELRTKPCEIFLGSPINEARRFDLIKIPKGTVSSSRIGRQKAAIIIPDEIHKSIRVAAQKHLLFNTFMPDGKSKVICQQSIEDIHYREGLKCYYFIHSNEDPCPEITPEYLWPNQEDYFLISIAYLFLARLSFFSLGYFLPNRVDLIDPGYNKIQYDELISCTKQLINKMENQIATVDFLESETDKQLYYVYKAATLCFQGHITGDGSVIDSAIKICQLARTNDKTSVTLVALEMLLNECMRRMDEVRKLKAIVINIIDQESSKNSFESYQFFLNQIYYPLYQLRFKSNFAHIFYEMYQTF